MSRKEKKKTKERFSKKNNIKTVVIKYQNGSGFWRAISGWSDPFRSLLHLAHKIPIIFLEIYKIFPILPGVYVDKLDFYIVLNHENQKKIVVLPKWLCSN